MSDESSEKTLVSCDSCWKLVEMSLHSQNLGSHVPPA